MRHDSFSDFSAIITAQCFYCPRDAMLARLLAMALCLSLTSRRSIKRNERINLVFDVEAFSTTSTLCFKEIQVDTWIYLKHYEARGNAIAAAKLCPKLRT